jgi:hypothetical protein
MASADEQRVEHSQLVRSHADTKKTLCLMTESIGSNGRVVDQKIVEIDAAAQSSTRVGRMPK